MQLLAVARTHGLVSEATEESGRSDRQQAEKEAMIEGLGRVRLFSPAVEDAEHYNETRSSTEKATAPSGMPAEVDRASGDGTDQLLMVSQAPVVYLPTGQTGKLAVARGARALPSVRSPGQDGAARVGA